MTVTAKKLAANRANAKKSTGPRTAGGKQKCSKNAVTHGIFCNDIVLPGEDRKIFESLRNAVLLKLCPQDIVELMIVDRIVIAQWKLRRLNSVEATAHMGAHQHRLSKMRDGLDKDRVENFDPDEPQKRDLCDELNEQMIDAEEKNPDLIQGIAMSVINDDGMLERLSRYEQRLELAIYRSLRQLEKLRKQTLSERPDSGAPPVARCPFLPDEEYEHARRIMREHDRNDENRPKESDDAPTADHDESITNTDEPTTTSARCPAGPAVPSSFLEQSDGSAILPSPAAGRQNGRTPRKDTLND